MELILTSKRYSPKPCFQFQQRGHCRYGARCKFSHESPSADQQPPEETETEKNCGQWSYMIPRPNARFTGPVDTAAFTTGWDLIESGNAGARHHIITKLSSETGLAIIKTLTDTMDGSQTEGKGASIFKHRAFPFFRIISHPDVSVVAHIGITHGQYLHFSLWIRGSAWHQCISGKSGNVPFRYVYLGAELLSLSSELFLVPRSSASQILPKPHTNFK